MSSQKQIAANRRNAKKSTGPKSPGGKATSSKNAVKHGLYSCEAVLPEENATEYRKILSRLIQERDGNGAETGELIRLIAESLWRLKRCSKVDTELFQMYGKYEGEERGVGTAFAQDAMHGNAFSKLARYRASCFRELTVTMKLLEGLGHTPKAAAGDRETLP
jgi:hypothetical protein